MEEYSIGQLQDKMRTGDLTARRCVELYLERIQSLDPQLCSVIEINPDVLEIAAKLELSVKTVETYKKRSVEKLGLRSRVDIVRYAAEQGWTAGE